MAGATGRRYAEAAFELALEHEGLERWEQDLAQAGEVLSDPDFGAFVQAPQVPDEVKINGINTLLPDVAPLVRNMLGLMVENDDIRKFPETLRVFGELADESRNVARAEVVTAVPLDGDRRDQIRDRLAAMVSKEEVIVTERVDEAILGGVIARVGDRLIDGSARTRLRAMRETLARRPAGAG